MWIFQVNNELGGNFNPEQFQFYSTYDSVEGAIQSYLISKTEQTVFIEELDRLFSFKAWEPIHTESSYKFLVEDIERMSKNNTFEIVEHFFDSKKCFVDSLWRVKKDWFALINEFKTYLSVQPATKASDESAGLKTYPHEVHTGTYKKTSRVFPYQKPISEN